VTKAPAHPLRVQLTIVFALAAVALTVYAGTLDNGFVWDDLIVIQEQLPYVDTLYEIFFPPSTMHQFATNYFRPLVFASYRFDESLAAGFWPPGARDQARRITYHASCVIYHAAATVLVFFLGMALYSDPGPTREDLAGAAAGALLFAVHPIHVESVAWMSGRSDVLCCVFFLAALICYLRHRRTGRLLPLVASALLFLGALLAKENALALLLLIPLVDWLLPRRPASLRSATDPSPAPGRAVRWGLFALTTLVYVTLRLIALGSQGAGSFRDFSPSSMLTALGWYVVKAVWPPPQSGFVSNLAAGYFLLGVAVLLGLVIAARRLGRQPTWRPEILAGTLFFATLAPSLSTAALPVAETPVAERYLYVPSAGLCLVAGFLLVRASASLGRPGSFVLPVGLALPLALVAGFATVQRAKVWKNDLVFWTDAVAKAPETGLPHLELGGAHLSRGDLTNAMVEYRKALERYGDAEGRSTALNNIGSIYLQQGRLEEAVAQFQKSLQEKPRYAPAHYNWALAAIGLASSAPTDEERKQRTVEAIRHLEETLRLSPRSGKAHLQYGGLLARIGRRDEGIQHLREALRLAPASEVATHARRALISLGAEQAP
jgi:Tfp pilus assembly protein PilF